jgi:isoquinoline 1-oxidoreductase subunit beta
VDKSIGVIKLAAEKANWGKAPVGTHQGFSAYYSHNTYVAEVAEVEMNGRKPVVKKVVCAVDCGIVINPLAAINQAEGGVIDGIGHALYGEFSFENGQPQQENFDKFRLIRMGEQPKVDVHFVPSNNDPTGLGEPTLPPAGAAVANAFFRATGERVYNQPFVKGVKGLG